MSKNKVRKDKFQSKEWKQEFIRELKPYIKCGTRLTLEGRPVSLERLAETCAVMERGSYMRDYISDSEGRLIEIRFDKVEVSQPKE